MNLTTTRQRQGVLTMPSNPRELTTHSIMRRKIRLPTVPRIGQQIMFNSELVAQDINPTTQKLGTPMSKIRYFADAGEWRQVGRHEAGMLVFFQNEPTAEHKAFVIRSIIPTQTAAYADLV